MIGSALPRHQSLLQLPAGCLSELELRRPTRRSARSHGDVPRSERVIWDALGGAWGHASPPEQQRDDAGDKARGGERRTKGGPSFRLTKHGIEIVDDAATLLRSKSRDLLTNSRALPQVHNWTRAAVTTRARVGLERDEDASEKEDGACDHEPATKAAQAPPSRDRPLDGGVSATRGFALVHAVNGTTELEVRTEVAPQQRHP